MSPSSSERSASSTGSGSADRRPKEQAPSNTTKDIEAKAAGAESDSEEASREDEEDKEEEDEEEDPEEEEKEGEEQSDKEGKANDVKDPDEDSSEDSSQQAKAKKEEARVRLVPAGKARSPSSDKKDRSKRSKSRKKDRSASKRKRRASSSPSRKRKSPKRPSRARPVKRDRSRSKSRNKKAFRAEDRNRSRSRKKERSSNRRKRHSSSSQNRRRSRSKTKAANIKAADDVQAKSKPAAEAQKEGSAKSAVQTPALSAAEELRQALFGNAKPAPAAETAAPKPAPAPKISFGLPKKPQVMDWRRRSAPETKPLQQNTGMVAVPGTEYAFRAHAGELAAAVAAAQALHNPRNREISRKIATLLEQCPPMTDEALTALRALPSDQVVQVLQTLASKRSEISDPSVWVNHVVNRLAVAAFNTAQGVPLPSTMVTEMLNRHLPKLATAAKSLLLQIPEVDAIKIIQDHLTYRGDASDSIFQAATTHLQQGIAASACSTVYPMTMDAFSMGGMGCGMMPMAMPGCFGAMMPGQMAPMAGCGMMGCAWGGAMPCATNGTTEATGTTAPTAPAAATTPTAPAIEDTADAAPANEEASAFAQPTPVDATATTAAGEEGEDNLPQEFVSSLAGVAPLKQEQPGEGC